MYCKSNDYIWKYKRGLIPLLYFYFYIFSYFLLIKLKGNEYMLIIGNYVTLYNMPENERSSFMVYNFSSLKDGIGKRLDLLPITKMNVYEKDFDQMYYHYIIDNDIVFITFMKMIYRLYSGFNVYIMISDGYIYEALAESLTKVIQVRYGYNAQFVHEIDDINFYDDSEFSSSGIKIFEQDRNRFLNLLNAYGMSMEGYM